MSLINSSLVSLLIFSLPVFAGPPVQGIHNFFRVDDHVYRGAQPTNQGFQYLAQIGIKTVLDLREDDYRASAERHVVTNLGMQYVNVPMTGLTPPTEAQISKILALLEDSSTGGVFVHCKRGADRTGAVIAAYRIDHDHWNNARAFKEAMGLGMSFFQLPRQGYILRFQPRSIEPNEPKTVAKPAETTVRTTAAPATALPAPAISR